MPIFSFYRITIFIFFAKSQFLCTKRNKQTPKIDAATGKRNHQVGMGRRASAVDACREVDAVLVECIGIGTDDGGYLIGVRRPPHASRGRARRDSPMCVAVPRTKDENRQRGGTP